MIPLRDSIPSRTTPVVNYAVIAITTLVFFAQLNEPMNAGPGLVERYGMIPIRVSHPQARVLVEPVQVMTPFGVAQSEREIAIPPAAVSPWATLVTCVFLHGGWMHFLGNMWFLWIFGDNVEDRFGHFGYVLFYLGCGIAASAAHLALNAESLIPTIGASGAIAGVMGAYMFLYPRGRVLSVIPIVFFFQIVVLPAPVFLGIWFVIQLFHGTFSLGASQAAGVAWWAHIGGFVAGYAVAWLLANTGRTRPEVILIRPGAERTSAYRYRSPRRDAW